MKQWIKMYPEMLHDRKMRKLSERDQLVFMKLLLLAGQEDMNGALPPVEDIALELYMSEKDTIKSLEHLVTAGIISKTEDGVTYVTNFQKRQESNLTNAEKVARYRSNQKQTANKVTPVTSDNDDPDYTCNHDVTMAGYICNENVTPEIDIEIDKEIDIDKELKERVKRENPAPVKESKHQYGNFKNVLLTDLELEKLKEKFPLDWEKRIENLSLGKAAKGYVYKSDYAAILNWGRKDDEEARQKQAAQPQKSRSFSDIASDYRNQPSKGDVIDL